MPITNKQVGNEFGVRVQGTDIECLNCFKLLGVAISIISLILVFT